MPSAVRRPPASSPARHPAGQVDACLAFDPTELNSPSAPSVRPSVRPHRASGSESDRRRRRRVSLFAESLSCCCCCCRCALEPNCEVGRARERAPSREPFPPLSRPFSFGLREPASQPVASLLTPSFASLCELSWRISMRGARKVMVIAAVYVTDGEKTSERGGPGAGPSQPRLAQLCADWHI